MSTTASKMLTYYFIQSHLLKRYFLKQLQNTDEQLPLDNILTGYEDGQLNY